MKISWILTALILLGAAALHHRNRSEADTLRREVTVARGEITAAGLDPAAAAKGEAARAALPAGAAVTAGADTKKAAEDAKQFALELIAFALEMEAKKGSGERPDAEAQKRILALMSRFMEMDEAGLRVVIDELKGSAALNDKQKQEIVGMSIMMLAQSNPESALSLFSKTRDMASTEPGPSKFIVGMCLGSWSEKSPAAALAWMDKPENAELVDENARRMAFAGLAKADAMLALDSLLKRKTSKEDDDRGAAAAIANGAKPEQRAALLAAAEVKPDPSLPPAEREAAVKRMERVRQSLLGGIAAGLVNGNFEESAAWLKDAGLSADDKKAVVQSLGHSLWGQDPTKWLGWMGENVTDEKDLVSSTSNAISQWTNRDYNAVGEWLDKQPQGALRTVSTAQFVQTLAPHEPASAATWALTIPETYGDRGNVLRTVVREWKQKDEPAATAFAAQHGIE